MDAPAVTPPKVAFLAGDRSDRFYLLWLLLLLVPLKVWLIYNTEVSARDSIGYIRYALHFEEKSWRDTVLTHHQHPGYSFCLWLVSIPVRAVHGGLDADVMRVAAQITSALASLLLLLPMFYLGKSLLGSRAAFWACFLFQVLPTSAHHLVDGVSEPLFLLLVMTALWQGARGLQNGSRWCWAACGLFGGLAYWTRPEGLFVVAAAGLVLLACQLFSSARAAWRDFVMQGLCLALPAAALVGAYVLTTGAITRKLSPKFMMGWETMVRSEVPQVPDHAARVARRPGPLFANLHAAFLPKVQDYPTRFQLGLKVMFLEWLHAFHYLGAIGVGLGLLFFGRHLVGQRGFWLLVVYASLQAATLLVLAVQAFYVSDRHMMVIVMPNCYLMAAGLLEAGRLLQSFLVQRSWGIRWAHVAPALLPIGLALFCMPRTLDRLHANRVGNHLAGLWLKEALRDGDIVVDDHCWSHYFAGQVFLEGKEPPVTSAYQPLCYVVMTRSKQRDVDADRRAEEDKLRQAGGRVVYKWPQRATDEDARVVIYSLPRDYEKNPWAKR